jgi:MFS family permease
MFSSHLSVHQYVALGPHPLTPDQMLLEVGAAKSEEEVGYAAGVVESVFSITQLLTVFHWGALSDRIGRKPVLILVCS